MRLSPPGSSRNKRLVKALTICCSLSMIVAVLITVIYRIESQYTTFIDSDDVELIQLETPAKGAPLAILHTTSGDMTYVLYPEECPNAVANFRELAESGYYDNTYVFRVEPGVFFSAGAPNADGSLKNSSDSHEQVLRELSPKLWPFRGALCALTTKADAGFFRTLTGTQRYYNGSRFLVVNSIEMTDEIKEGLQASENETMKKIADAMIEQGGIPNYAQQVTIFGQLIEGYEVLDAITGVEVKGEEDQQYPAEEIRILSVEFTEYS